MPIVFFFETFVCLILLIGSYPTKAEVYRANKEHLDLIKGTMHNFVSYDTPGVDDNGGRLSREQMTTLLDKLVAQKMIQLKVGAQVMLIKVRSRHPVLLLELT